MKAWHFTGVDEPFQLVDLPDPTPGEHEIVIDVKPVSTRSSST